MKIYITGGSESKPKSKKNSTGPKKPRERKNDPEGTRWVPPKQKKRFQRAPLPPHAVRIPHTSRPGNQAPARAGDVFTVIFVDEDAGYQQRLLIHATSPREARTLSTYVELAEGYNFKLNTITSSGTPLKDLPKEEQCLIVNGRHLYEPEKLDCNENIMI